MAQLNVELIVRKGTAQEWGSSDYILKAGEWGYDSTNKIVKIGDGTSAWSALAVANQPDTNTTYTFTEGNVNGEFTVTPSTGGAVQVKVHGLGSAAYTESSAYATAAQGAKADSAYQKPAGGITTADLAAAVVASLGKADSAVQSVTEGTANGTIAVDGSNVAVHGLGSAAYTQSSAYDAAGTAASAVSSHNASSSAHSDIRGSISGLDTRLDAAEGEIDSLQAQIQGLSGAMHYVGDSSTDPTGESGPTIPSHEGEYQSGDVCTYQQAEYVYDGSEWRLLGDEGSYLTKTEAASTYLTQSAASSTYETKSHASSTYATQTALGDVQDTAEAAQSQASTNATAITNITNGTTQVGDAAHADAADTATSATIASNYNTSSGGIKDKFDSVDAAIAAKADPSDITDAINALDKADSAVANQYVTAVSEANGVISVTRKQIAYSEISGTPAIPTLPENIVETITAGNDSIAVSPSGKGGDVTITHKAYTTGKVTVSADEPYYIDSITVERGHVTSATAKSLATALAELGTLTLNGGKADGTY